MMLKSLIRPLTIDNQLLILFLVGLGSLSFVTDIKSLLLLTFCIFIILLFYFKFSIKESLFLVMVLSLSNEKGIRGWHIPVVAGGNQPWIHGYGLYYGVSIRAVLSLTLFLLSIPSLWSYFKSEKSQIQTISNLVVTFVAFSMISTALSSDFNTSAFGLLRILQAVFIFFATIDISVNPKIKKTLFWALISVFIFNSFFAVAQYLNSGPLGIFMEDSLAFSDFGFFTTDGFVQYRTSALIGHPTYFASLLVMLLPFVLSKLINEKKQLSQLAILAIFLIGSFAIFTTFVRTGWIIFGLIIFVFLKKGDERVKILSKRYGKLIGAFLAAFIVFFGKQLFERLASSGNFLTEGSGVIRIKLAIESLKTFIKFPFFGVGLNLGTRATNQQTLLGPDLLGSLFPVHNTFLLFLSELGLFATISFVLLIFVVLTKLISQIDKNKNSLPPILSISAFIVSSQLHALFNQDPSFDLLFLVLGISAVEINRK